MKNKAKILRRNSRRRLSLSVVVVVFLISSAIHAETFFLCADPAGNKAFSDYPVEGLLCEAVFEEERRSLAGNDDDTGSGVKSSADKSTRVTIRGNLILVPVTFIHDRDETNANLVLDTGSNGTTIHNNIAERLYINLSKAPKTRGEVVGGGFIEAKIITMSSIRVGPHTFFKRNVFIVPHGDSSLQSDGLLGMDLLKELNYKIDFKNEMIIWK